jgi:FMN phosphatase YigB (HAD superfamily)
MRVLLDYGGVIAFHGDEREHADVLDADPTADPYLPWIAYFAFRDGFVTTEAGYVDLLSALTGADRAACREYVARTWRSPEMPEANVAAVEALASEHELYVHGNMALPWIDAVLEEHGIRDCFAELVVSSDVGRSKPHPRGYLRCLEGLDDSERVVMVSDEYDEDLFVASALGIETVWVEQDEEDPVREPDHTVGSLVAVPELLGEGN